MTRARTSNGRGARRSRAGDGPFDPFTWLARLLLRWQTFALLAVAALGLVVAAFWPDISRFLGDVQRTLVRTFGAGLVFVALALISAGLAISFRRLPSSRHGILRLVGGLALVVFIWG